mgnify:FL=1
MGMLQNRYPPNLPIAPAQYDAAYFNKLLQTINLFLQQLNSVQQLNLAGINLNIERLPTEEDYATLRTGDVFRDVINGDTLKVKDGAGAPTPATERPYGLFYSTQHQTIAVVNTAYLVTYDQTYLSNQISVSSSGHCVADVAGVYNFQFSAQVTSTSASSKQVYFWINKNGTDIDYSSRVFTVSGSSASLAVNWNFNIDLNAGQYVAIMWASDSTNVQLSVSTPDSPIPISSSAVMACTRLSSLTT